MLRHLVQKGVFEEPSTGHFALNAPARALLDSPIKVGLDLDSFGGRMARSWSGLLTAVGLGPPRITRCSAVPSRDDLRAHPDIAASFDALMGPPGHGIPDANLQITGGWESVRTVVDVGGGTGALLAEILKAHPGVKGTLVDLAPTVARIGRPLS